MDLKDASWKEIAEEMDRRAKGELGTKFALVYLHKKQGGMIFHGIPPVAINLCQGLARFMTGGQAIRVDEERYEELSGNN